jgi:hypothetical protein
MALCPHCGGEMKEGISCKPDPIVIGPESFEPVRWGEEREFRRWGARPACRDCNTPVGGVHHPGCCVERCPVCHGQALGCPCFEPPECEFSPSPHRRCPDHLFRQQRTR